MTATNKIDAIGWLRKQDTRVSTIALDIPKLRHGSYFPSWLLEPRRRAEQALVSVVVEAYVQGVSTRIDLRLVERLSVGTREDQLRFARGDDEGNEACP